MDSPRRIPEATVTRLPVYLRVLASLALEGTLTVSSDALAARAGVNAAQVRKDLSRLGSYGTRGVGYDVDFLVRQINRQLGLDQHRRIAIVGTGNLGQALAGYGGFPDRGFHVVAAFDADPAKVGLPLGPVHVGPTSSMARVMKEMGVEIAVITTPASAAQSAVDQSVSAGVGSILNFTPTTVVVPEGVHVRQVDLGVELQILSFYQQRVVPSDTPAEVS